MSPCELSHLIRGARTGNVRVMHYVNHKARGKDHMKRIAIAIILATAVLSGCSLSPKAIDRAPAAGNTSDDETRTLN